MAKLHIAEWIIDAHARGYRVRSQPVTESVRQSRRLERTLVVTQPTPPTRLPTAQKGPAKPSPSPPKATSAKTSPQPPRALQRHKQPKPRKRPKARLPINTWARFRAAHFDDPRSIARNKERPLAHVRLTREARLEIAPEQAFGLSACNYAARIDYAEIATELITRFTESLPRSTPVFWVTLIHGDHAVPYDDAASFNVFKLQQWVRQELRGSSFVGMVEAALYTNAGKVRPGWERAVSWHSHMLVWGLSKQRMREVRDSINVRVRTLIPGARAAHFRTLEPDQVEGQILYMLKAPVNEYRIIVKTKSVTDPETGEITKEPTGRFKTAKYQLGPGELTRMANLLSGETLDGLAFAGGEGKALLGRVNYEARAADRAVKAQERSREAAKRSLAKAQGRDRIRPR